MVQEVLPFAEKGQQAYLEARLERLEGLVLDHLTSVVMALSNHDAMLMVYRRVLSDIVAGKLQVSSISSIDWNQYFVEYHLCTEILPAMVALQPPKPEEETPEQVAFVFGG